MKRITFSYKSSSETKLPLRSSLKGQNAEPDFDLIEPRGVLGRVVTGQTMRSELGSFEKLHNLNVIPIERLECPTCP